MLRAGVLFLRMRGERVTHGFATSVRVDTDSGISGCIGTGGRADARSVRLDEVARRGVSVCAGSRRWRRRRRGGRRGTVRRGNSRQRAGAR